MKTTQATKEVALTGCSLRCIRNSYLVVGHSIPHRGYTHIGDFVVFAAALLFGYKVGSFAGAIGAVAVDLFTGLANADISGSSSGMN